MTPIWTATNTDTFKNTYTLSNETNFTMMDNMKVELEDLFKGMDEGCLSSCITKKIKVVKTFTS